MIDLFDLIDGKVGNVVEGNDWDEDEKLGMWYGEKWEIGEGVDEVDGFLNGKDLSKLDLVKSDGYGGVCCYSGWWKDDSGVYWLDIVNDYIVYKMIKV